jgi:hypothetical protein
MPFMASNLLTLYTIGEGSLTFRAISFTQSSWYLQIQALISVLLRKKMAFAVTSKEGLRGDFRSLVYPHLIFIGSATVAMFIGIYREGLSPAIITNIAWVLFNAILFAPFISSAFSGRLESKSGEIVARPAKSSLPI